MDLVITGKGRPYRTAEDLTDETYDSVLSELESRLAFLSRSGGERPIRERTSGRLLPMLARLIGDVRRAALADGWTDAEADDLATAVGNLLARVMVGGAEIMRASR